MNHISKLLGLTIISSLVFLFSPPSNARPIIFNININQNIIFNEDGPEVRDTESNPLKRDNSYLIVPSNTINGGQPANFRGIGLFSINQTCPFHVALSQTALPLKIKPRYKSSTIYKNLFVNFQFDYPGGQDCPEPKSWQLTFGSSSPMSNSRGYVKTGQINNRVGFRIVEVENQDGVYKLQCCHNIFSSDCDDINVVTLEPNVMVLVVNDNDGVPLHVKFQKV
ncbi:kunitz trypsin inhibitor 1-like [Silene latifolia]|uniref:kunitz trypsin inhibitor 1-like n=1 Tax=Silene latifolia TaxID=37657 RepID=UPI003D77712B